MAKAASQTSDGRMKVLAAANSVMSAYSAFQSVSAGQGSTVDGKDNQISTKGADAPSGVKVEGFLTPKTTVYPKL